MIQIGISTASFYPLAIERGIAQAAELGFQRVELFINSDSEYRDPFRSMLKKQLDAAEIKVVSVHPFTSAMEGHLLFSDYERRTQDALNQYTQYFEAAAALGANYFTFHGELLRTRGLPPAKAEERRYETYHELCARAASCGITFTQENVSWSKSGDLTFLRGLYQHVPELRYTLDIKQARRAGLDWNDYVDVVGDRIVNLHISDYHAQSDCLLPGQGQVDFKALFTRMNNLGYQGDALIEVYSDDYTDWKELRSSRLFLQSISQETERGSL